MFPNVIYFPVTHYFYDHLSFGKNALAKKKKVRVHKGNGSVPLGSLILNFIYIQYGIILLA